MNRCGFYCSLVVAGSLAVNGCAGGGGGGGGGGQVAPAAYRESDFTRTAELFLTQAMVSDDPGLHQRALDEALKEIASDPGNAVGYYQAARAQIGLFDYVAADTLLRRALALHPPYAAEAAVQRETAWINAFNSSLGLLSDGDEEAGSEDLSAAIEYLSAAEMIYPRMRPEALINLGVSYEQLGRDEEAIEAFGDALEVIRSNRPQEMMPRDSALATSWLEKETNVAFNRAMLYTNGERYLEAADEYGRYLDRHPGDIEALSNMAGAIAAAGMPDSAQAIYENLMGENLGIRDYFNIGVGLYMADNYDRAAEAFQIVLDRSPQNRDALLNLTTTLYQAERWHECVPIARRLVEADPYAIDHLLILASCVSYSRDEDDPADADRAQAEAGDILESYEAMPFNMSDVALSPSASGGGTVTGNLTNHTLNPGDLVTILVHFLGSDGETVGTSSIRVEAPDVKEACEAEDSVAVCTTAFRVDLNSEEDVTGFYFQVLPPRS